jgi:hypothetical protein
MRIRIDRRKRVRGRVQLCLKLILRDLLPCDCTIVSEIVSRPVSHRSLIRAARLPIPDGAIRDAPILRHTPILKSRASAIKLPAFRFPLSVFRTLHALPSWLFPLGSSLLHPFLLTGHRRQAAWRSFTRSLSLFFSTTDLRLLTSDFCPLAPPRPSSSLRASQGRRAYPDS